MLLTLYLFPSFQKVLSGCDNAIVATQVYKFCGTSQDSPSGDQKCSAGEVSFIIPYPQIQSPLSCMFFFPGLVRAWDFVILKVQV